MGAIIFYPVTLTLEFDSFFLKTLSLLITLETMTARAFILHMSSSCDKTTHLSSYLMQKIVSNLRRFIIHNLYFLANIVDNGCMRKKSDIHFIIRQS